jgi:hypothetical protein
MSTDGGVSWTGLGLPTELTNVVAVALGVDGKNLYVATANTSIANPLVGVYRIRLSTP